MVRAQTVKPTPRAGDGRRAGSHGPLLLFGVWVLVAGAFGLVDGAFLLPLSTKIVGLSVLLFAVGVILAALAAQPLSLRTSLVRLKLGPWVAVGFSVVFGLATLTWLPDQIGTSALVDRNLLVTGGAVALAGLLAMLGGYRLCPAVLIRAAERGDRALRGAGTSVPSLPAVLALWSISMAAQGFDILSGSFGYLADPTQTASSSLPELLYLLGQLGVLATLLAAWLYAATRRTSVGLALLLVVGSQLLLGLFSATKEPFVLQFIALFVGYGTRRKVRVAAIAAVAAVFVLFVTPFVTLYRTEVVTNSGRLSPSQVLANLSVGGIATGAAASSNSNAFNDFATRLSRIGDVTIIIQKTPSIVPYRSPVELLESPLLGVVPRTLWPSKPVLDAGYQMSYRYYELPPEVHTSNAVTPYGDLWWHGGLFYVLVGMLPWGFLARVVDSRAGDPQRDPRLLFLPMLLVVAMVKQETDYVSFAASLFGLVLLAAVAARLVNRLSRAPRTRAAQPNRSTISHNRR